MTEEIRVNNRRYRLPARPTVVVCIDGFDPAYLEHGINSRILPTFERLQARGFVAIADAVVPTFTNPNNALGVRGAPRQAICAAGLFPSARASLGVLPVQRLWAWVNALPSW
jgi:phosphonoacetate hydrolase